MSSRQRKRQEEEESVDHSLSSGTEDEDTGEEPEEADEEPSQAEEHDEPEEDPLPDTSSSSFFLWVVAGFIIIILAFAGSIYMSTHTEDTDSVEYDTYNQYPITNISGMWYVKIQEPGSENLHTIEMRNSPMAVEDIPLQQGTYEKVMDSQKLYLTVDPDRSSKSILAMIEVGRVTGEKYKLIEIPTEGALTESTQKETPRVTCANATDQVKVIYFTVENATRVTHEGNCITVMGETSDELIKAADRLTYRLLQVMPD